MSNRTVVALLVAAPLLAPAAGCAYAGLGADVGVWTGQDNWSPSTDYPKRGDLAVLAKESTFTTDFLFGTGDVVVSAARCDS